MSLKDSFFLLFGLRKPAAGSHAGLSSELQCPHEAEILNYSERKLSNTHRSQLEKHFASCENCRSLLVFLAQFGNEPLDAPVALSVDAIKKQTARIVAYIENDESKRQEKGREISEPEPAQVKRGGFFISYPQLAMVALIICALAAGSVFYLTKGQKPETIAMEHLATAMKDERRSIARISGGLDYSRHTAVTRGSDAPDVSDSDDLPLKRALNKLTSAESDAAPAKERQVLARVHLAFEKTDHARKALAILEKLTAGDARSPEILNDLGVAQFQLESYEQAIENFGKALENNPDYDEALFNRALAEKNAGRLEDARRDLLQFINQSSDANWINEAQALLGSLPASRNQ